MACHLFGNKLFAETMMTNYRTIMNNHQFGYKHNYFHSGNVFKCMLLKHHGIISGLGAQWIWNSGRHENLYQLLQIMVLAGFFYTFHMYIKKFSLIRMAFLALLDMRTLIFFLPLWTMCDRTIHVLMLLWQVNLELIGFVQDSENIPIMHLDRCLTWKDRREKYSINEKKKNPKNMNMMNNTGSNKVMAR